MAMTRTHFATCSRVFRERILPLEPASVTPARLAFTGILAYTLAQLAFLTVGCDWDLCGDEAEYWNWSRRLDWSYYAKGPIIALVIRLGTMVFGDLSVALTGSLVLAIRMPTLILSAITAWGVFRLGSETCRDRWAGLIALFILPAVPMFRIGGLLMTIDTPLICCWTWASVWSYRAIVRDDFRAWTIAGLITAIGVATKYTMLAFPASVGVFLLLQHRRELARPGFWLLPVGCVIGMAPIVYWNSHHGWAAANQMSDRLGLTSSWNWGRVMPLLTFLGGDFLVMGFWWPIGLAVLGRLLGRIVRGELEESDREGVLYLASLWVVVWSACVAVSLLGETEANWSAPAHLAVVVLIGRWLSPRPFSAMNFATWFRGIRPYAVVWTIGMVLLTMVQHSEWFYPAFRGSIPESDIQQPQPFRRMDLTNQMRGYRELGPEVQKRIDALRASGDDPFVLAPTYTLASEVSFYLPGQPEVYCLSWSPGMAAQALNQHDLWRPNPRRDLDVFRGRTLVLVEDAERPPGFAQGIAKKGMFRAEGSERFEVKRSGVIVGAWDITICRDYVGPRNAERMRRLFAEYGSAAYFNAQGGTPAGLIQGLFRDFFHRTAKPDEIQFWAGVLEKHPRELVIANLAELIGIKNP